MEQSNMPRRPAAVELPAELCVRFEGLPASRISLTPHRQRELYTKYVEPGWGRHQADCKRAKQQPMEVAKAVGRARQGRSRTRSTGPKASLAKLFRRVAEDHPRQHLNRVGTKSVRPEPQAVPLQA